MSTRYFGSLPESGVWADAQRGFLHPQKTPRISDIRRESYIPYEGRLTDLSRKIDALAENVDGMREDVSEVKSEIRNIGENFAKREFVVTQISSVRDDFGDRISGAERSINSSIRELGERVTEAAIDLKWKNKMIRWAVNIAIALLMLIAGAFARPYFALLLEKLSGG